MSRFDRYLLSQLLALFGFFSLVLVGVYWINKAVGLFDRLIGDGQSSLVFVEFSLLTLPNLIGLVLPISCFVAAVYVANRLMSESELVVMQATGFSAFRLARPALYFGLIVMVMMLVLSHVLVPASRARLALRSAEISQNMTARILTDGQFIHPSPGITLYIRQVAPSGELLNLFLADDRDPALRTLYTARKALFARSDQGPKLLMYDGMVQALSAEGARLSVTRFADFTYDLAGLIAAQEQARPSVAELSTAALLQASPALQTLSGETADSLRLEAHSRFSQPLLAVAAALIGFASLLQGAFSRFGLLRQILLAVAMLIVVHSVATVLTGVARGTAGAWPLVYVAPLLGVGIGAVQLWLAQRPRRPLLRLFGRGGLA